LHLKRFPAQDEGPARELVCHRRRSTLRRQPEGVRPAPSGVSRTDTIRLRVWVPKR